MKTPLPSPKCLLFMALVCLFIVAFSSKFLPATCKFSLDTRCKDDLIRGVRWEDYSEGAGCLGDCDENKMPRRHIPSGEASPTGPSGLNQVGKTSPTAQLESVAVKKPEDYLGIRGSWMQPAVEYQYLKEEAAKAE